MIPLRAPQMSDFLQWAHLRETSREYLTPWEPIWPSDDLTRSHFETQDTIELGQSVGGSRDYRSGFMSRLAAELSRAKPISFTDQLPLIFRGKSQIPNIGINSVGKPGVDDRQARDAEPGAHRVDLGQGGVDRGLHATRERVEGPLKTRQIEQHELVARAGDHADGEVDAEGFQNPATDAVFQRIVAKEAEVAGAAAGGDAGRGGNHAALRRVLGDFVEVRRRGGLERRQVILFLGSDVAQAVEDDQRELGIGFECQFGIKRV